MKNKPHIPPKLAEDFLEWVLKPQLAEEVLGDLEEQFYVQLDKKTPFRAKLNYWYQSLNYLRPFALRNNIITDLNPFFMFRHNLLLAYRNSLRNKSTSLINLIGLSTGLACALMISLWVNDELQVDKFHENDAQLYQVMTNHHLSTGIRTDESSQGLLAAALAEEIPEVAMTCEGTEQIPTPFVLEVNEQKIKAEGQWAGVDFFKMFSYDILAGDKNKMLQDKKSIVISEQLAERIFQSNNVIGQVINWQILHFKGAATISGVFKNVGKESSNPFDFLLPFQVYKDMLGEGIHWGNYNALTYVLLKENTNVEQLNKRLATFIKEKDTEAKVSMFLKPYTEKYLYGQYENGQQTGGRIAYVRLFSIIAIFILLIACINFMNLSTAKATRKLKDIGVRKTIGASRSTLVGQYLGESMYMAFLSLLVALILSKGLLSSFNTLTGKELFLTPSFSMIFSLLGITILTGLLAGSYPALYLSGFKPVKILKGTINNATGAVGLRKVLVIFQFSMSVILIVAVLVVYKQIEFIQNKNLGYNKENIITFVKEGMAEAKLETFMTEFKKINGVVNASCTHHTIVSGGSSTTGVEWEGKDPTEDVRFGSVMVYYDFIETLGVELLEGRSFSKTFGAEENNLILNETAIKTMGITNPIGRTIKLWQEDAKIVGVVKDFNFESLHDEVAPMFFKLDPSFATTILARIETGKEQETLSQIQAFYQKNNPGYAFEYAFLDATYEAQYEAEARVAVLSRYFAGLAILISCLGLFGLVAFSAQRRLKEIGIRKVLGATTFNIIQLLSADFTKMVLMAIVIAVPISYFIAKNWLSGFAFSIALSPWFFIIAGLGALLIAWLTIGLQLIKAVRVNPTECLKVD